MDQGDSVGYTVVNPEKDHATFPVIFDKVDLPQGFFIIQRDRHEIAHHVLQLCLVPCARQRHPVEVGPDIEVLIELPCGGAHAIRRFHNPLSETGNGGQTLLNR